MIGQSTEKLLVDLGLISLGSDNECSNNYVNCKSWGKLWRQAARAKSVQGAEIIARFAAFVDPPNKNDCWIWHGSVAGSWRGGTHGQFSLKHNQHIYAHRFSYTLFRGAIPRGKFVCHHCDVPRCVNPAHLFVGTALDNNRDASRKGRLPKYRRHRKMSPEQVIECLALRRQGWLMKTLAGRYGTTNACISLICSGQRRQHLPPTVSVEAAS